MTERVAYSRVSINGGAAASTVQSSITASDVSFAVGAGEASSWPDGTNGKFLVCFDRGNAGEEKAWAVSRSGATVSFDDVGDRGADGTTAAAHAAGVAAEVVIGAVHIDEANKAVAELLAPLTEAGQIIVSDGAQSAVALSGKTSGRILVGNGTTLVSVAVSGDATLSAAGALAIGANKITAAMMADDAIANVADIAADVVGNSELADNAVAQANIADDAVGLPEMVASAKPRWMLGPFERTVAAGDGAMTFGGTLGPTQVPMPEACAVVGLSVACGAARTAGSAIFDVTIDGSVTGLQVTIDDNPTQYGSATQAETADAVSVDQRIGITVDATSLALSGGNEVLRAFVLLQAA